ncbi:MAG: hypothetical protein HZB38_13090, partial [Planctomycetes bacterium]|nr:hypothetical protein [Planctomycetota bacterium]
MPISLLPSLALLLVQSPAATSSPDASTWATCGLEHVFFAGCDVNADHLEDVVIVGGDRKLYVSQNIA